MSRWFRHYAGMMRDEKLVAAAIRCGQPVERVVWIWGAILESAAEVNDGGRFDLDLEEVAHFLRCDVTACNGVVTALADKGRVTGDRVANWDKRQWKSDDSSDRVRKHREAKKPNKTGGGGNVSCNDDETLRNAPETETETETEKRIDTDAGAVHDEVLKIARVEPDDPFFFGSQYGVQSLIARGFSRETICAGAANAMRGKSRPPPWSYFAKCIESENEQRSKPAKPEIARGKSESLTDTAKRLAGEVVGFGPRPSLTGGQPDGPPVRLLSEGGRERP